MMKCFEYRERYEMLWNTANLREANTRKGLGIFVTDPTALHVLHSDQVSPPLIAVLTQPVP